MLYGTDSLIGLKADNDDLDKEAERIAKAIQDGEIAAAGGIDRPSAIRTSNDLLIAVKNGFKKDFNSLKPENPDWRMLENLEQNVYQFSCAKNMEEMEQITKLLKSGNRATFMAEVKKTHRVFNTTWLETERITAEASANSAARWAEYQETKELLPNLTYDAVNDQRTRDEHAALDGRTYPIDHEFWNTHYPPNGWRCRCGVQASDSAVSVDEVPKVEIPKMFRTNLAKGGLVFPKGHPYFKGKQGGAKVADKIARAQKRKEIMSLKDEIKSKKAIHPELGEINISTNGLKDILTKGHGNYIHKCNMLKVIDQVVAEAELIKKAPDEKNNPMVESYIYLKAKDQKDGFDYYLNIRKAEGGKHWLYSITDSIKKGG